MVNFFVLFVFKEMFVKIISFWLVRRSASSTAPLFKNVNTIMTIGWLHLDRFYFDLLIQERFNQPSQQIIVQLLKFKFFMWLYALCMLTVDSFFASLLNSYIFFFMNLNNKRYKICYFHNILEKFWAFGYFIPKPWII